MNFKVLALGALLGFAVAVAPSCGASKCSVANCKGCCSTDGKCVADPDNGNNTSCGTQGNACADCAKTNQVCNKSTYQCGVTGEGGGSGDSGVACGGCTLPSGLCYETPTFSNCGSSGEACKTCNTGEYCNAGVCTPPDAGTVPGSVGEPCTLDSQCTGVPMETGYQAFCKKTTSHGGTVFKDGYCTRRCLGAAACGATTAGNVCAYGLGTYGEIENICVKSCATTPCREGYACLNFGSTSAPRPACWVLQGDGGLPDAFDAGAGNPNGAGGACSTDTDCGNNPLLGCVPEVLPDGGVTGAPGGQCYGDCTLSLSDNWCGDGGSCLPYAFQGGTRGPLILFQCGQDCNPAAGAPVTCRTGYLCQPYPNNPTFGTCTADCRPNPTAVCGGATCDTTGFCK